MEDNSHVTEEITYHDLIQRAKAVAFDLKRRGLKKGDRVLILSTQTMDNVVSIVATVYAEAVFVIIPPPIGECKPRESKIALKLLLSLFLEDSQDGESLYQRYGESQATFSTVNTGLEEYGITCPPVDEKLIIKYLDFLESQGYLTSGGKQEKI